MRSVKITGTSDDLMMIHKVLSKWPRSRCLAVLMVLVIIFFVSYHVPQKSQETIRSFIIDSNSNITHKPSLISHSLTIISEQRKAEMTNKLPNIDHKRVTNNKEIVVRSAELLSVKEVNCKQLFSGSRIDTEKAKVLARNIGSALDESAYVNLTADCKKFQTQRGYIMSSLTDEEQEFPLAFSILVFKEPEMVERLLRAIYRPQNYYCIHVDKKSTDTFYNAMLGLSKCFPNVFIASKRIDVQWAWFTVLEPEILCMEELWAFPSWKYFFTLTGQEFPLKTNHELVKILTAYDGANDLEGTIKRANYERWRTTPPFGIRPIKGSVHITVNRDYVDYVLHNNTAKILLEWVKRDTSFPDETYFATLNHNPQLGIRGSYKGEPETDEEIKPFLTRYKNWGHLPCAGGNYVRAICILTLGDLPQLYHAKHYFANKFYLSEDRVVIGCLEEKIFNDTRDEYLGVKNFNVTYYSSLGFVKNKV